MNRIMRYVYESEERHRAIKALTYFIVIGSIIESAILLTAILTR